MGIDDRDRIVHYPQLGEPRGLTTRAAAAWRRVNTYYLIRGETVEVMDDPPPCFTVKEWEPYAEMTVREGWRLANSPFTLQGETPTERRSRQARSIRTVACDDCTLAYQLGRVMVGKCHPPKYATTPADRLLASNRTEGSTDEFAPGDGTREAYVSREARLPD